MVIALFNRSLFYCWWRIWCFCWRFFLSELSPIKYKFQSLLESGRPNSLLEPTLSRMMQFDLPIVGRSPLPTCCKYFTRDFVGLANWINSISGQSNPSEKISTLTIISIWPFLKRCTYIFLSSRGVRLSIFTMLIPAFYILHRYDHYVSDWWNR